ncbi:hypothetical protein B9G69_012705 [Bdellovibrio sp. SKB1291214]|uniref:hypothetical protein n=1 Tax=Bdellovibrio sp. SKB1291214 TaxID=1732569 RepID=UPI00223F7D99|nr:hypothetical protein [Bdellovibrio sp. SKB1291214]UYL07907.1 hypothetical protein B9G69_012705 [Bdellovibrio sp. SKB1291214]
MCETYNIDLSEMRNVYIYDARERARIAAAHRWDYYKKTPGCKSSSFDELESGVYEISSVKVKTV